MTSWRKGFLFSRAITRNCGRRFLVRAGLFMAQQEKVLACGPSFAALGLVLKFALGPAAMAIGSIAVGLRGDVLRVAIIQVPTTNLL
jgi:hypothetical protein